MIEVIESRALLEKTIRALNLPDSERIDSVWDLKNDWIPYPLASSAFRKSEELLARPRAGRMDCVLVFGEPNTGKTRWHEEYLQRHPIDLNLNGEATKAPVIGIQIKGSDEDVFYNQILDSVHAPLRPQDKHAKKLHQILQILSRTGTRQLLLDELNTAISGPKLAQKKFLECLKFLANQLKLSIIATGTDDARLALVVDKQIRTRFKYQYELKPWRFDEQFFRLLASFEERLPLRKASRLQRPRLAKRLLDLSEGYLGDLAELLMQAAVAAIRTEKEEINLTILDGLNFKVSH